MASSKLSDADMEEFIRLRSEEDLLKFRIIPDSLDEALTALLGVGYDRANYTALLAKIEGHFISFTGETDSLMKLIESKLFSIALSEPSVRHRVAGLQALATVRMMRSDTRAMEESLGLDAEDEDLNADS